MMDTYDSFADLIGDSMDYSDFATDGESSDWSDAAPRGRGGRQFGRVPTARSGQPVPQQAASGYATKAELQATAQRLDSRIATNSKAIATVDGRTRTLATDIGKLGAEFRKEVAERKAVTEALKKGLDESRQLALLLPLLSTSTTTDIATASGTVKNVMVDDGDQMSKILPILLLSGGLGSSSPGTSGSGGMFGGDNSIALLAIATALSNKK
jgi:hypothetical protein